MRILGRDNLFCLFPEKFRIKHQDLLIFCAGRVHDLSASQAIMGDGVADIAEVFLTLWAADRQLLTEQEGKATAEICRVLGNYARPFIILQPRALLWQGEYARLRGKPRAAKRKWSKGLTIAQAYNMQFDQACLRSRLDQEMAD